MSPDYYEFRFITITYIKPNGIIDKLIIAVANIKKWICQDAYDPDIETLSDYVHNLQQYDKQYYPDIILYDKGVWIQPTAQSKYSELCESKGIPLTSVHRIVKSWEYNTFV